ncbi:hypothetical protein CC86DRAFT_403493 [Ophiobolus disseminans]|uniref:C2H2-type domain-containing protein n=1 Tax=Ophiobolus disseminans TaxID=1469910 RepID=A0A6A7AC67_9PLEO|nr:hypothetical protein CC86DRAFT_403493 [Ophiobolus disseminans]
MKPVWTPQDSNKILSTDHTTPIGPPLSPSVPANQVQDSLPLPTFEPQESRELCSRSNSSDDEALDTTEESLGDSSPESISNVEAKKKEILDKLMVLFYEIFTATTVTTHGANGSPAPSRTSKQSNASERGSKSNRKKRKSDERDDNDQQDEDEEDKSGKRQKNMDDSHASQAEGMRLACPYYKRNHQKHQPSRACAGPGWPKVHRLKEHLYREHAMPLFCRRCNMTFENESQITDHSRSMDMCIVTDTLPPEGFDKDQEKELKKRKKMFRAESEEQKWKIVYLILFPDTALTELPTPYYDIEPATTPELPEKGSPKAHQIKQFDAFMNRELPRKVRKALELAMERKFGPIEETLKNDLENIIRNCQEALTRTFFDTAQSLASSSTGPTARPIQTMQPVLVLDQCEYNPIEETDPENDVLSQFFVPPETPVQAESWPTSLTTTGNGDLLPTWSDSGYFSYADNPDQSFMSDTSIIPSMERAGLQSLQRPNHDPAFTTYSGDTAAQSYVGKGKGRARNDTPGDEDGFQTWSDLEGI